MVKYWFWGGVASLVLLLGLAGIVFAEPYQLRGSVIDPPLDAPNFTLTTMDNERLSLSQLEGDIVLMFFGFTTCPDVCPTTLAEMKQVYDLLGDKSDHVKMLFITVDPDRDTPVRLKSYVSAFNPKFVGLTGSIEELEKVWKDYGVYREIRDENSASGYTVDHSARVYLINSDGHLNITYTFGTPVNDIEQDIRYLLRDMK